MRLKLLRKVVDKPFLKLLDKYDNIRSGYIDHIRNKAKVKSYVIDSIIAKGIGFKNIRDGYDYELQLFRSKREMDDFVHMSEIRALNIVKRCLKDYEPDDQVSKTSSRYVFPENFMTLEPFEGGKSYEGNWIHVDMNSAEPYALTTFVPELVSDIDRLYKMKKKGDKIAKSVLVYISGHTRNTHFWIYKKTKELVHEYMLLVTRMLRDSGAEVLAIRADAVIARVPDDWEPPQDLEIGDELGQFKITRDKGTITLDEGTNNFMTDMTLIESKNTGQEKMSYLYVLDIIASKILNQGVVVRWQELSELQNNY